MDKKHSLEQKHPLYFEGTFQLREPTQEVVDYLEDLLLSKKDVVRVSRTEEVTNGFDFYLSSKTVLMQIGKILYRRFGGELKVSNRLFSRDRMTSKEIYRITVMYRPARFKIGSIVNAKGHELKVEMIKKNQVLGKDVKTGEKIWFKHDDAK